MYAGAAAGVVSAVVGSLTTHNMTFYVYGSTSSSGTVEHTSALASGILGGIIAGALWLWMAWKTGAGRAWARVLSCVFFGFQCLALLGGLFSLLSNGAAVLGSVLSLAEWGIGLAALILLWQPESSQFFAFAQQLRLGTVYGAAPPGYPPPGYPPSGYGQPPTPGQPGYGEPPR
jgi:hypothetical protein